MSHAKDPGRRQRRNKPKELPPASTSAAPRAPKKLPAALRRAWVGLWASGVGTILDPVADLPTVRRLFDLYVLSDVTDKRITDTIDPEHEAADGDPTLDSLITTKIRLSAECRLLEASLGMSPRARLALGQTINRPTSGPAAPTTLDDFADEANDDDD